MSKVFFNERNLRGFFLSYFYRLTYSTYVALMPYSSKTVHIIAQILRILEVFEPPSHKPWQFLHSYHEVVTPSTGSVGLHGGHPPAVPPAALGFANSPSVG